MEGQHVNGKTVHVTAATHRPCLKRHHRTRVHTKSRTKKLTLLTVDMQQDTFVEEFLIFASPVEVGHARLQTRPETFFTVKSS